MAQLQTTSVTGSLLVTTLVSASSFTGSLFGTASAAITASYAANAGTGLTDGTTNYIPLWTSATAQSSSVIYQSGSNIGINKTNPSTLLDINGEATINGLRVGTRGFASNTIVGQFAAVNANTSDAFITAMGWNSLSSITSGIHNTGIGAYTLLSVNTNSSNTAVGYNALAQTRAIGGAGGNNNTAIGKNAGSLISSGSNNTIIGSYNGTQDGLNITTGSSNIVLSDGSGNARLYYDGANNFWAFRNNGSERVRIDTNGNVGIGTTSPQTPLHVQGSVSASTYTSNNGVYLGAASTLGFVGTGTTNDFQIRTGGTEKIRVQDSTGNVGINTSSPGARLHIQGNVSASSYTGSLFGTASLALNGVQVTNPVNYRVLTSDGTSAGIVAQSNLSFNGSLLLITGSPLITDAGYPGFKMYVGATQRAECVWGDPYNSLYFQTFVGNSTFGYSRNGTYDLYITSSGNVGLGTLTPANKLQVQGNVSASSYTSSLNNAVGYFGTASVAAGVTGGTANYIPMWTSTTIQSSSAIYQSSGNIGIGTTSPSSLLHVAGTLTLANNTLSQPIIKDYGETKTSPSISSNTLTLDLSTGNVFVVSLNANINTLTISNPKSSGTACSFTLILTADGTARTVTWGASVKWPGGTAPTLTSTNTKNDTFVFTTWDGGTTWYAFTAGQNS